MHSPNNGKIIKSLAGLVSNRFTVYDAAEASLGKHRDWFVPNDQMLLNLRVKMEQAHQRVLPIRSTRSAVEAYKDACQN